jgi:hypothetical protein
MTDVYLFLDDAHAAGGAAPAVENYEFYRRNVGATFPPGLSPMIWMETSGVSGQMTRGDCMIQGTTATQVVAAGGRTLTFNVGAGVADTITASTGSFTTDGYKVGMRLRVRGTTNNDGAYLITGVAATTLTLGDADVLVAEGPLSSAATLDASDGPAERVTASGGRTLTFASGKTITASSGSWINDGYEAGHRIKVTGSASNDSMFTVVSVTATVLTVSETMNNEGPVSSGAFIDGTFGAIGWIGDIYSNSGSTPHVGLLAWKTLLQWENLDWVQGKPFFTTNATSITGTIRTSEFRKGETDIADNAVTYPGNQQNWKFMRQTSGKSVWWDRGVIWGDADGVTAAGGRTLEFKANSPPGTPATIEASSGDFAINDGYKHGMVLTVTGTSSNNGTYEIEEVSALKITLVSTDTLVNEGPLSATATLAATQTTSGNWVEYCAVPNLNGKGNTIQTYGNWTPHFIVPPHGSNTAEDTDGGLGRGIEPLFIDGMHTRNQDDRCIRMSEGNGSIHVVQLLYDGKTEDFTVGATLTGGTSGCKGVIVAIDDSGATGELFLNTLVQGSGGVDGWFENNEALTDDESVPGTAVANGTATGWAKGGAQYNSALNEWLKSTSSTKWSSTNSLGTESGDAAINIKGIHVSVYVRDIQLAPTDVTTAGKANAGSGAGEVRGTFTTNYEAGLKQFITDVEADFSATSPIWIVQQPTSDYYGDKNPFRAGAVRSDITTTVRDVEKVTAYDTDGFLYSSGSDADGELPPSSLAVGQQKLWYESAAYDAFGKRAWDALILEEQGFSPPSGAGVPFYMLLGQSQALSVACDTNWLTLDADGDLAKLTDILPLTGGGVSTVDGRKQIWNGIFQAWQSYNTSGIWGFGGNSMTLGNGSAANFGPEASWFENLIALHPETGAYLFKMAQATSSINAAAAGQTGVWEKGGPSITSVQATMSFSGNTITAPAGTFDAFTVGEYIQIVGSLNNNTGVFTTYAIQAIDPTGATITVAAAFTAEVATPNVTIKQGGVGMYDILLSEAKKAMEALVSQLGVFPDVQAVVWIQGEGDIGVSEGYQTKLANFITDLREDFQTRTSGRNLAFVIVKLTDKTPLGTNEQVAQIRAAQDAVAAADSHITTVETSGLPLQAQATQAPGGLGLSFGDLSVGTTGGRTNYGVHWTPRGIIELGFDIGTAWAGLFANEAPTSGAGLGAAGDAGDAGGTDTGAGGGALASVFEVETGTASSTSNSYASVSEADIYFTGLGRTTTWATDGSVTDAQKEIALRNGTQYLDDIKRGSWKGVSVDEDQSLAWPRYRVYDSEGWSIDHESIPALLKQAAMEAAERNLAGVDLAPDESGDLNLTDELIKAGPITIDQSFAGSRISMPRFSVIERKLAGFVRNPRKLVRA